MLRIISLKKNPDLKTNLTNKQSTKHLHALDTKLIKMPKFSSNSERAAFEWARDLPLELINDTHVQSAYRLNLKPCFQKLNSCK